MTTEGPQDHFADVGQTLADLLCLPVADQPRESRRGWMSDRLIRGVTELVDTSGILDLLATWREEDDPERATKGGRPSLAEERTCLIILLALTIAGEHPLVVRVAEAYSSRLQTASRDLLNLPRANPTPQEVSDTALYHRVYRALHRILSVIDPYPGPRRGRITRAERLAARHEKPGTGRVLRGASAECMTPVESNGKAAWSPRPAPQAP